MNGPYKDLDEVLQFSYQWKEAQTEQEQKQFFEAYGWRWSPLLRLPYWNPVRYTIIESMHALDLNLLSHHIRDCFIVDLKQQGSDGAAALSVQTRRKRAIASAREIKICLELIKANDASLRWKLLAFKRSVLYQVCLDCDIRREGNNLIVVCSWLWIPNGWIKPFLAGEYDRQPAVLAGPSGNP
ncbi:hypothetical protein HGRIS_001299 [Hohenbuehelia grisea]|uniref:Uncharacterized protein n=1 Tax=Hohenbuehelia grisea TaxID=104357 RepID=A0ABR3JR40_9AGAR